jgi:phosphonate transport system substrate-binding protein
MVRGDLDDKVRRRLQEVLQQAADDPGAREAMLRFFKTTRFLPIDAASQRALGRIRDGAAKVRTQVE